MGTGRDDSADTSRDGAQVFQQRFLRLAEMSSDGICVHQDGQIVFANAPAIRWMGVDPAVGLIGRKVSEFVDVTSFPDVERRLQALQQEGDSSRPSEVLMGRPLKSTRDVQATSMRIEWDGQPAVVTNFRDLTPIKTAAVLKDQAALLNHISDAVIGISLAGTVTTWNAAAETIYGRNARQVLHLPVSDAVGVPLDAEHVMARGGAVHTTHVAADGSPRSVRITAAAKDGGYVLVCADLTALRRAERHFEAVVMAIDAGVVVFDSEGTIVSANPTARLIFAGMTRGTSPFASDHIVFDADGRPIPADRHPLREAVKSGVPQLDHLVGIDHTDGQRIWLSVSIRLLSPSDQERSLILCTFVDVTSREVARKQLAHRADHDALTGLPNRSNALARLTAALVTGAEKPVRAVFFIDMDNVKLVNDSYGHGAGDAVLTAAANRMGDTVRDGDLLARLAGDEFVVLLFEPIEQSEIDRLVDDLHHATSEPIPYRETEIVITASIGVALVGTNDVRDALEILNAADEAMYVAKSSGPGRTRYAPAPEHR